MARFGEMLAADERLLPVLHKNGCWTLVTDAYHFPEGRGRPFQQARYGEFRTLPDGRALLAGLADGHLQAIEPAPASQAWKEAEDETENKTQTREGSRRWPAWDDRGRTEGSSPEPGPIAPSR